MTTFEKQFIKFNTIYKQFQARPLKIEIILMSDMQGDMINTGLY